MNNYLKIEDKVDNTADSTIDMYKISKKLNNI
jgi:hypothetical protein